MSDFQRRQTAARVARACKNTGELGPAVEATLARAATTRAVVRANRARRAAAEEQRRELVARRREASLHRNGVYEPPMAGLVALLSHNGRGRSVP